MAAKAFELSRDELAKFTLNTTDYIFATPAAKEKLRIKFREILNGL
jgi:hypothetical protein